jgi:hypothetical protein
MVIYMPQINLLELRKSFVERIGIFGQKYLSARFEDKEITIDDLTVNYRVCICTPYCERRDKKHVCKGAGEVIREWTFDTFRDSLSFLIKENVV